ncbi:MAG: flagellar export chaperone FliS [Acidobacteria bacterium]|nr:flagellar export chaperone FliS [Acidobacteriota bacterium]
MQPYAKANDEYLLQRINSSSPEQMCALLLEGAQRFVGQAVLAMDRRDISGRARSINRASAIVEELMVRLNHEQGGPVVENLVRIYEWWTHEMFEGSKGSDPSRLNLIAGQMGELKETWEKLHMSRNAPAPVGSFTADGMVG